MAGEKKTKVEVSGVAAPFWLAGWLFTIGFAHLGFWKAFLAIVLWPFFLGRMVG